jgi:hypothetical protein
MVLNSEAAFIGFVEFDSRTYIGFCIGFQRPPVETLDLHRRALPLGCRLYNSYI